MARQTETLASDGYAVFPGVFTPEQVAELRDVLRAAFERDPGLGDTAMVRNDICSRFPETRVVLTNPRFLEALRAAVGEDPALLPEMVAHFQGFGGWHKDTTTMELAGHDFHREPDFRMFQCAIYLQDQTDDYGGGLEVVPGSHNRSDRFITGGPRGLLYRLQTNLGLRRVKRIESKAGDLVMFDLRCDHRATQPRVPPDQIPTEHQKFAIFFVASANNRHAASYRSFIESRDGYEYLKGHVYPREVVEIAAEKQLTLA